jgi:hypothetical protein
MEITLDPMFLWDVLITVIILPLGFLVRGVLSEQKRLDILVNKTREEIARDYVTRDQMEVEFQKIMDAIDRLDQKLDRLQAKTYFQE